MYKEKKGGITICNFKLAMQLPYIGDKGKQHSR